MLLDVGEPGADVCWVLVSAWSLLPGAVQPTVQWVERRTVETPLVRNIVDQQDAHGTAVVCRGDGPEALLAGCVPDLQLDALAVKLDGPYLEVDADGGDEGGGEGVFAEAQQTAGFTHTGVANQQKLDLSGSC